MGHRRLAQPFLLVVSELTGCLHVRQGFVAISHGGMIQKLVYQLAVAWRQQIGILTRTKTHVQRLEWLSGAFPEIAQDVETCGVGIAEVPVFQTR